MPATALIVDDEADIRELIAITLTRMGWDFHAAATLEEARNLLGLHAFDICLTDMRLPDGNGVDFVKYAQKHKPHVPIAVITAHGNMEAAVDAMKNGAYDFVSKPVDISQLRQLVTQAVELKERSAPLANESVHAAANTSKNTAHEQSLEANTVSANDALNNAQLIGESPSMQELRDLVHKVSRTNAPVWITGESGTEKETIARSIHEKGPRSAQPFVIVNCGAIPANLIESEVFGTKADGLANSTSDKQGLYLQADRGTLFLDEVDKLPLQVQVKLLRVIQERLIQTVKGEDQRLVNVRIISASHNDLADAVEAGRFRHDLYYRLNVVSLNVPSLRERPSDIALLVEHILKKLAHSQNKKSIHIDEDALRLLSGYDYPGNVRELETILERASTLMDSDLIETSDLNLPQNEQSEKNTKKRDDRLTHAKGTEYQRIVDSLNKTHWNRKAAAELLGLTYRQLRYRIKQLGIDKAS